MFSNSKWKMQFYKGQLLYCKNGETVVLASADEDSIYFIYKNVLYRKNAFTVINKTLFTEKYDPKKKYYDLYGFDSDGFDWEGFNCKGFDREGFDREGFDAQGKDRDGRLWVEYAKILNTGEEKLIHGMNCTPDGVQFKCCDCGDKFIFIYSNVQKILEKDWNWPRRCKICREKKKNDDIKYEGLRDAMKNEHAIRYTGREQAFRFRGPYEEL